MKRLTKLASLALLALSAPCFAQYVTLTGNLQASNGLPAKNYTISFTPSQFGFIAGTGALINTSTTCATSIDGSVVGLPNPLTTSIVTASFTGTLPASNYYVKYAWTGSTGLTLVSPESVVNLSATGSVIVPPPASGAPNGAVNMNVYIATSSGAETLQGNVAAGTTYTQSVPLVSGAAMPTSNTTVCKQVANDAIWPVGTGYTVSLADPGGDVIPGYPMMWQLLGANTTINVSSGLPYYHGVVTFPSPILASPLNQALQSINGSLSVTGSITTGAGSFLSVLTPKVSTIRFAEGFTGSDCGAKINAAFADIGMPSGQVWVSNLCAGGGNLGSTPINVPVGGALVFGQVGGGAGIGGVYSTSGGFTLNANSSIISAIPCAPDACSVTLKAANNASLTALVTVSGADAVMRDLKLDGNASALGGICANNAGTTAGSYPASVNGVVNITGGGSRLQMANVEVVCGADAGITAMGAQNIDLTHMEVLFNTHQGFYCKGTADGFIGADSQFEANGYSGIELQNCGGYRVYNSDLGTNGASGSDHATGCGLYIHGLSTTTASNNNEFVETQFANTAFEDICDIGWDQANNGRANYSNSYFGIQTLNGAHSGKPSIYVSDGSNENLIGTVGIGDNSTASAVFTETATGRAVPSSVRLTFGNGTTAAGGFSDTVRYPDDFSGSVIGNTAVYQLGPFVQCQNLSTNPSCGFTDAVSGFNDFGMFTFFEPGQSATGGYTSSVRIGRAGTTNNAVELGFVSAGAGSASNTASLGLVGGTATTVDGNGNTSVASGTNVVYRCATAGATLPIGSLTTNASACGSTTDTGLRVK